MLQSELEKGIGQSISYEDYCKINECYSSLDILFRDKNDVYSFYTRMGMGWFKALYSELEQNKKNVLGYKLKIEELKSELNNKEERLLNLEETLKSQELICRMTSAKLQMITGK